MFMPLTMTDQILADDILDLRMLKNGVVYQLIGKDRDELVIKVDVPGPTQIKAATVGVKAIDPSARMKVLTAVDRMALRQFADRYLQATNYYNALAQQAGALAQAPNNAAVDSLRN